MEKPLITVIIPCYNCAKTMFRAVDSVLQQDYPNLEVFLIDDGSTDETLTLAQQYAQADHRVTVIPLKHSGVSVVRNTGLERAKGEYVAFIDADDNYTTSNALSTMLTALQNAQADRCICNFTHPCFEQYLRAGVYDLTQPDQFMAYHKDFFVSSMPWNKLTRRTCLTEPFVVGLGLGEDEIFNLANLKNIRKVVVVDQVLYNYYCTPYVPSQNASAISKTVTNTKANFTVWHMFMKNQPLREEIVQRDFPAIATDMANIRIFDFMFWIFWLMAKNRISVNAMLSTYCEPVFSDPLFMRAMESQKGWKTDAWNIKNITVFSQLGYYAFADIKLYHRHLSMYDVFLQIMAKIFIDPKSDYQNNLYLGAAFGTLQANQTPEAIYVNRLFNNPLLNTSKMIANAQAEVLDLWLGGVGNGQ